MRVRVAFGVAATTAVLLAALASAGGTVTSALPQMTFFKTPSGNIVCVHAAWSTGPILECKIKSGLKPKPPYTRACREIGLDHNADRISLPATGRVPYPGACHGDAGATSLPGRRRVLGYGQTWSRGSLSCRSEFTGLTCRNRSRHGFFLSRERWRRF